MNIFENYRVGEKCEYLRQQSPNIWRKAIITDVSIKNRQISVVTDTGNYSTHNIDNVRLVFDVKICPTKLAHDAGESTAEIE